MQFVKLHPNFTLPTRATEQAGGYDLYMPDGGFIEEGESNELVGLGFAAKVPDGCVALIMPRSGAGAKRGIELRNTVGVIDSDYTGEWKVAVSQRESKELAWNENDRLFQYVIVPIVVSTPHLVDELVNTTRGDGFGSTGV